MEIPNGVKFENEITVKAAHTAKHMGSGLVEVLATPMMIAFMEYTSAECIRPYLESGLDSVGTAVNITHISATPVGMKVKFCAQVVCVDRKRVDFKVEAYDEVDKIGEGTHSRFIIDVEKFGQKADNKGK